jgi:hypothetical protein
MDKNSFASEIQAAHQLYCQLTAQKLPLRFDRERLWYDFLQAGFTTDQLKLVIAYLQKEIRAGRRNVGALKLSNLLQPDRFDEDLNIAKVRLQPPPPSGSYRPSIPDPLPPTPAQLQKAKLAFKRLRQQIRNTPSP